MIFVWIECLDKRDILVNWQDAVLHREHIWVVNRLAFNNFQSNVIRYI